MKTDQPLYREILATEQEITERTNQMAGELIREFQGKNPLFVCLLRGGIAFASKLMFAITEQDPHFFPELDYMTVSRYGEKLEPSSSPRVIMDLSHKTAIAGRPVIIVDDLIDKGGTYIFTKKHLENKGADKVYLAVLIQRELNPPREIDADYYCFSVASEEWFVGMGMDDARLGREANRWAPYVAIANPN